jgi:DNA mismatch repair ATPase MutS
LSAVVDAVIDQCPLPSLRTALLDVRESVHVVATAIVNTLDEPDATEVVDRVRVRRGLDRDLDELRDFYTSAGDYLTTVGREEMGALADTLPHVSTLSICYYPQIGCLLVAPVDEAPRDTPGLEFKFATQDWAYFKNARMHELDDFFGDVHSDIADEEARLVRALSVRVAQYAPDADAAVSSLAEVDATLALARASILYDLRTPELVEAGADLHLEGGWHPLLPAASAVANNVSLSLSVPIVIVGPNMSGKSVYLHMAGTIAWLALVGSDVPAASAVVPRYDGIFLPTTSAGRHRSFAAACTDTSRVLDAAAEMSCALVVLDEPFKATTPTDGAALVGGLAAHLRSPSSTCHALISTHYASATAATHHTAVVVDETTGAYTVRYRVAESGREGEGEVAVRYGLHCARVAGLDDDLVARARDILAALLAHVPVEPAASNRGAGAVDRAIAVLASPDPLTAVRSLRP